MEEMTRLQANEQIIYKILDYIRNYPDMRFGQALYNMGIATHCMEDHKTPDDEVFLTINRDIFFEESVDTLEKLTKSFTQDESKN